MATVPCNVVNVSACEGDDVVVDNKSNKEDEQERPSNEHQVPESPKATLIPTYKMIRKYPSNKIKFCG